MKEHTNTTPEEVKSRPEDIDQVIRLLHPFESPRPLVRMGPFGDGGYLIPDDLDGVSACLSPGVSTVAEFELDMAKRRIPSIMVDHSVNSPPYDVPGCIFVQKFVGSDETEEKITLDRLIDQYVPQGEADIVLQMDIEGSEFDVLSKVDETTLSRFRIIVVEFHALVRVENKAFCDMFTDLLAKLNRQFAVVHLHPNNVIGRVDVGGYEIPRILEVTFLRRDRLSKYTTVGSLPHALDSLNVKNKPETLIPNEWFEIWRSSEIDKFK